MVLWQPVSRVAPGDPLPLKYPDIHTLPWVLSTLNRAGPHDQKDIAEITGCDLQEQMIKDLNGFFFALSWIRGSRESHVHGALKQLRGSPHREASCQHPVSICHQYEQAIFERDLLAPGKLSEDCISGPHHELNLAGDSEPEPDTSSPNS